MTARAGLRRRLPAFVLAAFCAAWPGRALAEDTKPDALKFLATVMGIYAGTQK